MYIIRKRKAYQRNNKNKTNDTIQPRTIACIKIQKPNDNKTKQTMHATNAHVHKQPPLDQLLDALDTISLRRSRFTDILSRSHTAIIAIHQILFAQLSLRPFNHRVHQRRITLIT